MKYVTAWLVSTILAGGNLLAAVSGTVVDAGSGTVISGAMVQVQGTLFKQTTGTDGKFSLLQTTGITDKTLSGEHQKVTGSTNSIFSLNGNPVSGQPLPDGIYLVRSGSTLRRIVKCGPTETFRQEIRKKGAGTVTLVVTKTGYNNKTQAVADGATNVRIELSKVQVSTSTFPDAITTGIKGAGLSYSDLKSSGSLSITTSGAVIDKLDISGIVRIKAPNVTIKRCRIRTSRGFGIDNQSTGLKVEYVEIIGVQGTNNGIQYNNYTARYCDISGSADGAKANGNVLIEHCYIHDLRKWTGTHNDCIQVTGGSNITFRGNRLMGPWQTSTSCIKMDSDRSPLRDVLIEENFLSGGSYLVYSGAKDSMPCPSNVRIINNTVHRNSYVWGYLSIRGCGGTAWSGNVWSDTGTPVK